MSTYENMTYEELVKAMLDKVTSDVDKREGSLIFDAVAPCAFFLTKQKFQLVNFIDLLLPDTALGDIWTGWCLHTELSGKRPHRQSVKWLLPHRWNLAPGGELMKSCTQ